MPFLTGQELAYVLDLDYETDEQTFNQVANAADDLIAMLVTTAAYDIQPAPLKEAAVQIGGDMYQARTAVGGQPVSIDFTPGPYRMSIWITRSRMSLIAPYMKVGGMLG